MSNEHRPLQLFCLGADSGERLLAEAQRWNAYVTQHRPSLDELSRTMHASPSYGPHRLALLAANINQVQTQLRAVQKGGRAAGAMRHVAPVGKDIKAAFLFSGHGSQYAGMGRALFAAQPVFREAMLECEQYFVPYLHTALTTKLYDTAPNAWLEHPLNAVAALFAVQYSLAQVWRALGVQPAYVMGYSAGEIVAATVAGALHLRDGIDLLMCRTRILQGCQGVGGTAFVFEPVQALEALLAAHREVSVAAVHSASTTMVAGARPALGAFLAACEKEALATQNLTVQQAVHSPWVDPVLPAFRHAVESMRWSPPSSAPVLWVSTMTGRLQALRAARGADYWCEQLRRPVLFADAMQALTKAGVDVFIEVGPNANLLALGRQCVAAWRQVWLASIRRDAPELKTLLESVGVLHTCGAQINLRAAALDPHFSQIVS